jgi:hypothetical protein
MKEIAGPIRLMQPLSLCLFASLIVAQLALAGFDLDVGSGRLRSLVRFAGYAAVAALVCSYLYPLRGLFLNRRGIAMRGWLILHIVVSYIAMGCTLIHSLGHATSWFTYALMLVFWIVVGSGACGYLGQWVCYRFLSLMVSQEVGPGELDKVRDQLKKVAVKHVGTHPEVKEFCGVAQTYLDSTWPTWTWLFRRAAYEPVAANWYQQLRKAATSGDRDVLDAIWRIVEQRRQMDIEYWFHRLARAWLFLHNPAAWALAMLVLVHVWWSVYYGGW